jgi:pimeloyl-ACP methyl ester carboxylesterase
MAAAAVEIEPPPLPLALLEVGRALSEMASLPAARGLLRVAPSGDGHSVLVCPGFLTSDVSTGLLRRFIQSKGYRVAGWELGRNMGPGTAGADNERLAERVIDMFRQSRRKVSLVGWSLGGVLARELAKRIPDQIRQVITLGSPLAVGPNSTSVSWIYQRVGDTPFSADDMRQLMASVREPPAHVPSTAIFSKSDGIVPWRGSIEPEAPLTDNIEVRASHCGLGVNPLVFYAIADRLALPENGWTPFDRTSRSWRRIAYPSSGHGY